MNKVNFPEQERPDEHSQESSIDYDDENKFRLNIRHQSQWEKLQHLNSQLDPDFGDPEQLLQSQKVNPSEGENRDRRESFYRNYQEKQPKAIQNNDDLSHQAEWHWDQFGEFFFYNIIFYFFLGPLICPLLAWGPGLILMKNMQFYPAYDAKFLWQSFIWIGTVVGSLLFLSVNDSVISIIEISFMWSAIIQRIILVSSKYATFTQETVLIHKTKILTDNEIYSHQVISQWRIQPIQLIYYEIENIFKRSQRDQSQFLFQFTTDINEQTLQELQNMIPIDKHTKRICGYKILALFIKDFQKKNNTSKMLTFNTITVFILAVTPVCLKMNELIHLQVSPLDIFRLILNGLVTFLTFSESQIFLTIGIYDLHRILHLLKQCSKMIQNTESSKKLVPSIDLHNPQTIQAWSLLRTACFDYGQSYNIKTQGFYSVMFLESIFIILLMLSIIARLITINTSQLIILLEIGFYLLKHTIHYLILGGEINNYFDKFSGQLEDIEAQYVELRKLTQEYLGLSSSPTNLLQSNFINQIKSSKLINTKDAKAQIKLMIQAVQDCTRLLQYDERNNSFQMYGVTISYNLLKSIFVAIATVIGYAVQQRFQKKS